MTIVDMPKFSVGQLVSATTASKQFGELRKRARIEPQLIMEHNQPDCVLMSYSHFELMFAELQAVWEEMFYERAARRVAEMDAGKVEMIPLEEVVGPEGMAYMDSLDPDAIPDEELFE